MGTTKGHHRPLVSGITVAGARQNSDTRIGPGTLTCLATRNNAAKTPVLVTNLHVLAGGDRITNPDGNGSLGVVGYDTPRRTGEAGACSELGEGVNPWVEPARQ